MLAVPAITLSSTPPQVARAGSALILTGRLRHAPGADRAQLSLRRSKRWSVVASAPIRRGFFRITWHVPSTEPSGPVSLRVAARDDQRVVARTKAVQSAIGPAPVLCAPPPPPAVDIPVGDGWIAGGRYFAGGPFPGIYQCDGQDYTVTATDANGVVEATQSIAGAHSYTLVVPAGQYALKSDFCTGSATVSAGEQTNADTVCPVP